MVNYVLWWLLDLSADFWHCRSSNYVDRCCTIDFDVWGCGSEVVRVLISVIEHKPTWSKINNRALAQSTAVCLKDNGIGTSKIQRLHRRSGKPLIDDHLLDHHMYADDTQLIEYTTASNIPNAIMKGPELCWINTWVVADPGRLQLNPAKTELIWFGSKASLKKTVHLESELVHRSWRHKAGWCRPRSRGFPRRTEYGPACKDRRPQLFFPSPTSQIGPAHPRQRGYTRPGVSLQWQPLLWLL